MTPPCPCSYLLLPSQNFYRKRSTLWTPGFCGLDLLHPRMTFTVTHHWPTVLPLERHPNWKHDWAPGKFQHATWTNYYHSSQEKIIMISSSPPSYTGWVSLWVFQPTALHSTWYIFEHSSWISHWLGLCWLPLKAWGHCCSSQEHCVRFPSSWAVT